MAAWLLAAGLHVPALSQTGDTGDAHVFYEAPHRRINLAGEWRFWRDPMDTGVAAKVWSTSLPDRTRLPSATSGRPSGPSASSKVPDSAQASSGIVWYQRTVAIPAEWRRRRVTLFLERCLGETRAWLNGTYLGSQDSVCAPHVYELTRLAQPGSYNLTIRLQVRPGDASTPSTLPERKADRETVAGILGKIELRGTARVWLDSVRCWLDRRGTDVVIRSRLGNVTGETVRVAVTHYLRTAPDGPEMGRCRVSGVCRGGEVLEARLPLPAAARVWQPGQPTRIWVVSDLEADGTKASWVHSSRTLLCNRTVDTARGFIRLNGAPVYLRGVIHRGFGEVDWPVAMSPDYWKRLFASLSRLGVNHMRFAGWCPPEAAFHAADQAGMVLLVEGPLRVRDYGRQAVRDEYLRQELIRTLRTFGHHPSFVLLTCGTEFGGEPVATNRLVAELKAMDSSRLFSASSGGMGSDFDDFAVAPLPVSALRQVELEGRNAREPQVPVLAHELEWRNWWCDIREAGSGPWSVERIAAQSFLEKTGQLALNDLLVRSCARSAAERIRDHVESLLLAGVSAGYHLGGFYGGRTRNAGTGPLDAMGEAGASPEPDWMCRWCADRVLLMRSPARVLTPRDAFTADLFLLSPQGLPVADLKVHWSITLPDGSRPAEGELPVPGDAPAPIIALGTVRCRLDGVQPPAKLRFETRLSDGSARNEWTFWVFSAEDLGAFAQGVYVDRCLSKRAREVLAAGGRVVVLASASDIRWSVPADPSRRHLHGWPSICGLWCDPQHASFRQVPVADHLDELWLHLLRGGRAMVPWRASAEVEPLVVAIPAIPPYLPVYLAFQARVGEGRLLVCSVDLRSEWETRHDARQFVASLLDYAASSDFQPKAQMRPADIEGILRPDGRSEALSTTPPDLDRAALRVRPGGLKESPDDADWSPEADIVVRQEEGIIYKAECTVSGSGLDAAWHVHDRMNVELTLPEGLIGEAVFRVQAATRTGAILQVGSGSSWHETIVLEDDRAYWLRVPVATEPRMSVVTISVEMEDGAVRVSDFALMATNPTSRL